MITHITLYMYVAHGCHPFAAIKRSSRGYKFYKLTKASAWMISHAIPYGKGTFSGDGQGWSWTRTEARP